MKEINIKHINNLHSDALRSLDFYKQEITILTKRLEEIAADNTGHEAAEKVEHFQNQFLIQYNNIDELKHGLHENLNKIENQVKESAGFISQSSAAENVELYDQYLTEEKIINEVRQEFNRFASKWM
ncbi:hypothetical protein [Daejeonella sp.]|uniref:hypothetical protein n=1 Tax=Daejeonella sp. TaxID=2805397 RepID=UPI002716C6F6|nr:hypothetical protein [Daejeonella sp.]MDO8993922.1 hypothetical protein [Daejeonella sp.]MDP2412864.1 hypothetical protein [Daejeonella sp.]